MTNIKNGGTMKKLTIISIALLAGMSLTVNDTKADGIGVGDINGNFDEVVRCRYKDNACYGGNAISLRAACYKGKEAVLCSKYNTNCRGKSDSQ